jgi:methylthioribose-1-phosphate isomerase
MRTVFWGNGAVRLIDQRLLPERLAYLTLSDAPDVAAAIRDMAVRGAPAIGAAAAFGLAAAAARSAAHDADRLRCDLREAGRLLRASRPTASNLAWAVDRVLAMSDAAEGATVDELRELVLAEAQNIADEDVAANEAMGAYGATLLADDATVLHHCNTGALATVEFGTALGVVRAAHASGKRIHVLVDETRPLLQGARLTAWELQHMGVPHTLIVDGAAGHYLHGGTVDAVLVGADRIAANGDTANKIGTYALAVVARENGVPFYVVAPTATIDLRADTGREIPIESRPESEVTMLAGRTWVPAGTRAANPAFDVTPHRYISAIVTERGILGPPFDTSLRAAVTAAAGAGAP